MKVFAINGSPRKNRNTAQMLQSALDGVKSVFPDAETEMIQLYDLNFTGCRSCLCCKLKDERFHGVKCFWQDELTPILDELAKCDGIIIGTPIYLNLVSAGTHAFWERLVYPYSTYEIGYKTTTPKRMPVAMIYTMNWPEEKGKEVYATAFKGMEAILGNVFTPPEVLNVYNTYQFDDYSKYNCEKFSEPEKRKYRDEHFDIDLQNAFDLGVRLMERRKEQMENE